MEIGIVGISQSGKTTLFHALAGSDAGGRGDSLVAVVKAPDPRLDFLNDHYEPQRKVQAEFKLVDFAGAGGRGFSSRHLAELRNCDALVVCLRAFENEAVSHPEGKVDAARDLETIYLEFALADLEVAQRRIENIDGQMSKSTKAEREQLQKERPVLEKLCKRLEEGGQVREEALAEDVRKLLRGYGFLTEKPLIVVANVGEEALGEGTPELPVRFSMPATPVLGLCAKIENELAEMAPEDRAPFLEDLGLKQTGREAVLQAAWQALGLLCFYTVGKDEVRAWPLQAGSTAVVAAGKIHSDIARGFIRAEVVAYEDFTAYGDMGGVKEHGKFRLEGKEYVVADGDIMLFRFNV